MKKFFSSLILIVLILALSTVSIFYDFTVHKEVTAPASKITVTADFTASAFKLAKTEGLIAHFGEGLNISDTNSDGFVNTWDEIIAVDNTSDISSDFGSNASQLFVIIDYTNSEYIDPLYTVEIAGATIKDTFIESKQIYMIYNLQMAEGIAGSSITISTKVAEDNVILTNLLAPDSATQGSDITKSEKVFEDIELGELLLNYIPFIRDFKLYTRVAVNLTVLLLSIVLGATLVKGKKAKGPKVAKTKKSKKSHDIKIVEAGSAEAVKRNKVNF